MDFFATLEKRRSCRKFAPDAVPAEVIEKAIDAALIAPNSSNIQPWEFYWVASVEKKAKLAEACFSQGAAKTAAELVVAVARVDTWRRHRKAIMDDFASRGKIPSIAANYYSKVVPLIYLHDRLGILAVFKKLIYTVVGLFRPAPRGPAFRSEIFEMVAKTTALACENLMLAVVAQGYDCCPMEGFDESRVKSLLGVGCNSHIVMVIGIGKGQPEGFYGPRFRVNKNWVVHKI